jgi:CHASE3 domain sensor protein
MLARFWHSYSRPSLMGVAAALLISNVFVVWLAQLQLNELREPYVTAEKMRATANSLLIGVLNAEVGARGFLITGDEIYLGPYATGVALVKDQLRTLSVLPLDQIQRGRLAQVELMTNSQLDELTNLVRLQRERGGDVAAVHFQTGADKVGLETLRSFIDRTMVDLSNTIATMQQRSKDYQTISSYSVIFAAFWLYLAILLAANSPRNRA